jgi:hypothetical protein
LRCLKFGRECDGYEAFIATPSSPREILPSNLKALVPLETQPALNRVEGGQNEHQYFRFFRENTAFELSGGYDDPVWNRMVLQTGHTEPSIQRLTIAIGALSRAKQMQLTDGSKDSISAHNRYAMHEYGKALKAIRKMAIAKGADATRNVMIASMLIYCFESFHGNTENGIKFLRSALAISLGNQSEEEPLLYRHLEPTTPSPDIEPDLITAFARLEGSLRSRIDAPALDISVLNIKYDYYNEEFTIPDRFTDNITARRYLEHIQYRSRPNADYGEILDVSELESTSKGNTPGSQPELNRVVTGAEFTLLREQLAQWFAAFDPFYEYARTPAGAKDYIAAVTVRVNALAALILLQGQLILKPETLTCEPSPDLILNTCREIVQLCRELVADRRFLRGFMFDLGIIPGLLTAIVSSPDISVGKEAVEILKSIAPRKEGTWDSVAVAQMGEGIIMMKEMQAAQGSKTSPGGAATEGDLSL